MDAKDNDRYRAPALDKGLDILELLAGIDGGLTQSEIARHLGRNPNEFYRMLDTLVKRGYVTKLEGDRYSLTLKLFGLAQLHAPVRRLASYATPLMRELAEATRQANQLVVFDRGAAVVVAQSAGFDHRPLDRCGPDQRRLGPDQQGSAGQCQGHRHHRAAQLRVWPIGP